jgi:4-amino-4-deoxy-L-arabinose transferase-like glycosyltransferase
VKERREILILLLAALLVRVYKGVVTPVIAEDGVAYIEQASLFLSGAWGEALGAHYPPLYPLSLALVAWIISDPIIAGKAVSAIFGTLGILPLRALGLEIFPAGTVRIALVLYIVSPFLLTFSGEVLSESAFVFFVLCALAGIWKGRLLPVIGSGISLGLATLTRPEGAILFPFGLVALGILSRRKVVTMATFAAVCLLPLVPYTLHLRSETGHWQFSRKGAELLGGLARYAKEKGATLDGYDPHRIEEGISLGEAGGIIWRNPGISVRKYLRDLLLFTFKSFPHAVHPVGFALFLLGLVLSPPSGRSRWCLAGFLAYYLVCIAWHFPNPRYLVAMAAPALLWQAEGIEAIRRRRPRLGRLVLILALGALSVRAALPERRDKIWMREAAEIIRAETPGARVCSRWRRIAFYAGGEHVPRPWIFEYDLLLDHCREAGATHLVLEREGPWIPFFEAVRPEDLRVLLRQDEVVLFRLE